MLLDEVRAGGRIPLIIGKATTYTLCILTHHHDHPQHHHHDPQHHHNYHHPQHNHHQRYHHDHHYHHEDEFDAIFQVDLIAIAMIVCVLLDVIYGA